MKDQMTPSILPENENKQRTKVQYKKVKLIALLLLVSGLTALQAQEAIPAASGNIKGSTGSVSYSYGQLAVLFVTGATGSIAQGVQQPYTILAISGTDFISLICSVSTTTGKDILILKLADNYDKTNLRYQLSDKNNTILVNQIITSNETVISLETQPRSTYFLKVIDHNIEVKYIKIIKN